MTRLILGIAVVMGSLVATGSAGTELHTYGHYSLGSLHCTAVFDHWPQVEEFHYCGQVCANNATIAVLD